MKRIAVFASGGGTDFQSIIDANESERFCEIAYLIASKGRKSTAYPRLYFQKTPIPIWKRFIRN